MDLDGGDEVFEPELIDEPEVIDKLIKSFLSSNNAIEKSIAWDDLFYWKSRFHSATNSAPSLQMLFLYNKVSTVLAFCQGNQAFAKQMGLPFNVNLVFSAQRCFAAAQVHDDFHIDEWDVVTFYIAPAEIVLRKVNFQRNFSVEEEEVILTEEMVVDMSFRMYKIMQLKDFELDSSVGVHIKAVAERIIRMSLMESINLNPIFALCTNEN